MRGVITRSAVSLFALATALVAGAGAAQGCTIFATNAHYEHAMPDYVRSSQAIFLARAVAVQADIGGAVDDRVNRGLPMGDTHLYDFEIVEVLKGSWPGRFELRGGAPFGAAPDQRCSDATPEACFVIQWNEDARNHSHDVADGGRDNWTAFHQLSTSFQSGMGLARHYPPMVRDGSDCRTYAASFEIGETFLIFVDRDGPAEGRQARDLYRLNHQLITRQDDAWLGAVRHFVANPEANTLPAEPFSDLMAGFGVPKVIRPSQCQYIFWYTFQLTTPDGVRARPDSEITSERWRAWLPDTVSNRLTALCDGGQDFVIYPGEPPFRDRLALPPFPIINGRVDFSYLPGPWTFTEGEQIPLHMVMSAADADR